MYINCRRKIKNDYINKLKENFFSNEKNIEVNSPSLLRELSKTIRFKSTDK